MAGDIKHVVGLLCKQLNIILNMNLKPEHLRLAKFDKNEENVIPTLWTTLSLLTTKERQVDMEKIKEHLKSMNYTSEIFYSLPENYSSGSRELLIAIAFMLAKNLPTLINEEICQSPFDDLNSLINTKNIDIHRPEIPTDMVDENHLKNYQRWLKGRTQQNEKMTEEYKSQITKMYNKLNDLLNIKANGNLSLNEVLALSSKKYCKEFLEKITYIMHLLEVYQEWTKKEKIFWNWMATVLIEKQKYSI